MRTLHNVQRHETSDRREGWLLRLFDRWTSYGIAINAHTDPPAGLPAAVILHGHYRDWFARFPQSAPVPGRLAYFGLIRPYKGVEDLIAAFRGLPGEQLSLTVSGKPRTPELAGDCVRVRPGTTGSPWSWSTSATSGWPPGSARRSWSCCRTGRCTTPAPLWPPCRCRVRCCCPTTRLNAELGGRGGSRLGVHLLR